MTRGPAPSANSVSVTAGVSDTMRCGSLGMGTTVPSPSVTVANAAADPLGAALGLAGATLAGAAVGLAAALAGALDAAPPDEHAARTRTIRLSRVAGTPKRRDGRDDTGPPDGHGR